MFGGSEGRAGFIRTRISTTEKIVGWVVLGLIVTVALWVYLKGRGFDPGLFALEQSRPSETASAQSPLAEIREGLDRPVPRTPDSTVAIDRAGLLHGLAPPGWQATGEVEQFSAENLYEKIDGKAEQYLAYDVHGLTCASFLNPAHPDQFIDIYLYDMGLPPRAFGIFSVERPKDLPPASLGREGYRAGASLFFWKGRYYVQVLPSEGGGPFVQAAERIAQLLAERLEDSGEPLWGPSAFPRANLVPGTVQYFLRDALSLDFMKDTYTAHYRKAGNEVTAFLSRQPGASSETMARYLAYLSKYGKLVASRSVAGDTLVVGDVGGYYDVVFRKGSLIGGVSTAQDQALAEQVAEQIMTELQAGLGTDRVEAR